MARPSGAQNLSQTDRDAIIRGHAMGMTMRNLARMYNTSVSTVSATIKKPIRTKSTGRPRKTTANTDRIITRMSKNNPRMSSVDINRELKEHHGVEVDFFEFFHPQTF